MNILVFVIAMLFACQGEAKKKKKKSGYEDGGIQIRDYHEPKQVYHPEAIGGHKNIAPYYEDHLTHGDHLELLEPSFFRHNHYLPPKDPYERFKKAQKVRYYQKKKKKIYKKKVHHRMKNYKFINGILHKGFNDWGKQLFKKHTYPLFGPADEVYYAREKVEPVFVTYERAVFQPSKEPRLVEVRVPKCEPGEEVPLLVTSTLVKKHKHPITITKTKTKTTHVKLTEYVVNTSTVTTRLTLPQETVTTYYTATEWETQPSKPVYKAKHYREAPTISDYRKSLMSSMMELLAEKPYTSLFSDGNKPKNNDKN